MEPMEWDVNFQYDEQDFVLVIDLDRYFQEFPKMRYVQINMMGKKYKVDRIALAKMMEVLEAI